MIDDIPWKVAECSVTVLDIFSFLWHLLCPCCFFELPASCCSIWILIQCIIDAHLAAKIQLLCSHAVCTPLPGMCPTTARASAWWRSACSHWGWVALAPLPVAAGTVQAHGWHQGIPKHSLEEPDFSHHTSGLIRKEALFLHFHLCRNALSVGNHKEEKCKE